MQIAVYVRVSTDKQELHNQINVLSDYCVAKKYHVVNSYQDIISGSENSRPGFDDLFHNAKKLKFKHVLFWSLDRFSRSGTLFTLQKLQELSNLGVSWESYQEPYLNSIGEFKDVVISIMATLAKIEKKRISERTKIGIKTAKEKKGDKLNVRGPDKKQRKKSGYHKRWEKIQNKET